MHKLTRSAGRRLTRQRACQMGRRVGSGVEPKAQQVSKIVVEKIVENDNFSIKFQKIAKDEMFFAFPARIFQKIIGKFQYLGKFSNPPTISPKILKVFDKFLANKIEKLPETRHCKRSGRRRPEPGEIFDLRLIFLLTLSEDGNFSR